MNPSPLCEYSVNGSGFVAIDKGINVQPGAAVQVRLATGTGVFAWVFTCYATDDQTTTGAVNALVTVNSLTRVASFTAPAAGTAMLFRSVVNGGVDASGRTDVTLENRFGIYALTTGGRRTLALNETLEGDPVYGWLPRVNDIVRESGSARVVPASALLTTGAETTVLSIGDLPNGTSIVDVYGAAATAGNVAAWSRKRSVVARRTLGGNVTLIGTPSDPDAVSEAATSAFALAIAASGTALQVRCTGAAQWNVVAQILSATNPNAAPPGPVPNLVSLLPTSGTMAGGTSVVLTGTDFTGATAVSFGGVAAASFTVDSSTQITAVTPALTAGAKDVSVTTPYGTDTLAASFTASAFSLAALAWEVWLKGSSRTSSQITGTASAGTSGNANRKVTSTGTNAIAAGATFNALPSIDWNSDDMWSFGDFILSDIVSAGGNEFTCIMVMQVNSYTATGTAFHDVPRIFATGGGGAYFGIGAHDDGAGGKLVVGLYDGAFKTHKAALATATKQVVAMRLKTDGTLGIKVGAAAWSNLAGVGAIASLTNYMNTFSAASPGKVDCDIAEFLFAKVGLSDGDVSSAQTALAATYGIAL